MLPHQLTCLRSDDQQPHSTVDGTATNDTFAGSPYDHMTSLEMSGPVRSHRRPLKYRLLYQLSHLNSPPNPNLTMPSEPQPKGTYTLDLKHPALHLSVLPDALFVHRFPRGHAVPSAFLDAGDAFVSVTRTKDEVSVVADKAATEAALGKAEQLGGPWAAMKIAGPLEHRESS